MSSNVKSPEGDKIAEYCRQYGAQREVVERLLNNQPLTDLVVQRIEQYHRLEVNPVGSEPYKQALTRSWQIGLEESRLPGMDDPLLGNADIVAFFVVADRIRQKSP